MTASKWSARELERRNLLKKLRQKIIDKEGTFGEWSLCRILLPLLDESLVPCPSYETVGAEIRKIPQFYRREALHLFFEIMKEIRDFRRSEEEEKMLLAKLFEWTAKRIARPYFAALLKQQEEHPMIIYNATNASEEVSPRILHFD